MRNQPRRQSGVEVGVSEKSFEIVQNMSVSLWQRLCRGALGSFCLQTNAGMNRNNGSGLYTVGAGKIQMGIPVYSNVAWSTQEPPQPI
jgi:hypothetical protein